MFTSEYFAQWLELQKTQVRLSTWESLYTYFTKHIIPYFDQVELTALTPLMLQKYVNEKLVSGRLDGKSGGLSVVSVRKHLSVMKQALDTAVLYGYIERNPAQPVKLKKQKSRLSKRTVFLDASEAQSVVDSLRGEPKLQTAVLLALWYGLRRSEVLGLRWQSVDFERDTIAIEHTVVKNLTIQATDETKTEDSRAVYRLLPDARTALLRLREERVGEYVFEREDGSVMRPDSLTRTFQRRLVKYGFKKMRFHDLRHSTASLLFANGWSLEDVKNWLRHTDIETTSNIYLHYQRTRNVIVGDSLALAVHL